MDEENEKKQTKLPDLSRVMTLPTELRALIFKHAVTYDHLLTYRLDPFLKESYHEAVQPALTRVNRQIRAESLPLYYESNEFVLHTECTKSDDGRRWLRSNSQYLSRICHVSFWLCYVTRTNMRSSPQGAFSVSIRRRKRSDVWTVDNSWDWITVVRKPMDMERDGEYLVRNLADMVGEVSCKGAGPNDYYGLMMDLRMNYRNFKT